MYDDFFNQDIPLHEASHFFVGLTKQAEWTDPPDSTGTLEGAFLVPVEQVLAKLKEVITVKYRLMVAYHTYAQSFREHGWRAVKIEFTEHAEDEQCGASYYTKRAVALGGPVHMDEVQPPPATTEGSAILRIMARAEQEAIAVQRELKQLVGDDNPMKVGIEEHMHKDQHHLDEMWQMMTTEEQHALTAPAPEPEQHSEVEEAPTEQEVVASMRLSKAAMSPRQAYGLTEDELSDASSRGGKMKRMRERALSEMNDTDEGMREHAQYAVDHPVKHRLPGAAIGGVLGGTFGGFAANALGHGGKGKAIGALGGLALGGLAGYGLTPNAKEKGRQSREYGRARDLMSSDKKVLKHALRRSMLDRAFDASDYREGGGIDQETRDNLRKHMSSKVAGVSEEFRDPRLYSNVRGMLTRESPEEVMAHHKKLKKGPHTIRSAAREGWYRGKKKEAGAFDTNYASITNKKDRSRAQELDQALANFQETHKPQIRMLQGGTALGVLGGAALGGLAKGVPGAIGGATLGGLGGMFAGGHLGKSKLGPKAGPAKERLNRAAKAIEAAEIAKRASADKSDKELKEVGRQRGVSALSAEATRDKGKRGERGGAAAGGIAGALGGAAAGKKYIGGRVGALGGMAAGYLSGSRVGAILGNERDMAKRASMRFTAALYKLAEGEEMAAPSGEELQPTNYLAAEMAAQKAQEDNESSFYRQQLGESQQSQQVMQQQMSDVQAQLQQLQTQADQSGAQIQQASQEAMAARDDAVNATMEVAKARMGAQRMRQAMMEVASQDPAAMGEEAMGQQMAPDNGMGQPAEEGPAGQAPDPSTPQGAAPPQGVAPQGAPTPGAEPVAKQASAVAMMGALAGGASAAYGSVKAGRNAGFLRQKMQQIQSSQDGSFGQAAALAAAQGSLAGAELAQKHPTRMAIGAGVGGALTGSMMAPGLVSGARELGGHVKTIAGAIRRSRGV